ncbi:MAG: hypothetical protein WAO20_01165 [Acidobacteriota bacterium]
MRRVFAFIALVAGSTCLAAGPSSLDGVVIPRKTDLFIELMRSINSKTAQVGDKFAATVQVPVTVGDKIVIPVGAYVIGHVADSKAAGYIRGKAQMLLGFDTVILPDGTTRQIRAVVQSADQYSPDPADESGRVQAPGDAGKEVAVGAAKGAATGAITGATIGIFRGQTLRGAGIGSLAGAAGGALIGLLDKGEEVELPKGAGVTIQLQEDIEFVKPEATQEGRTLKP